MEELDVFSLRYVINIYTYIFNFSFYIDYIYEGYKHKYIPDILIEYNCGKKKLCEIKPNSQKKLPKNLAKWSAAADYCKKRNWEFIVLTEKGLKLLKNKSQNIL